MAEPDQEPEIPVSFEIDIDQWKRDIQIFASTTQEALEGIVSDLSGLCNDRPSNHSPKSNLEMNSESSTRFSNENTTPPEATNSVSEDRFSSLKARLAARLEKQDR
ncbi:MAG: hypothetical protein AAF939_00245 [Planctomycetota bacterium]